MKVKLREKESGRWIKEPVLRKKETLGVLNNPIINHVKAFFGKPSKVFQSEDINVIWIKPSEEYPFNIIVSQGLSNFEMTVPKGKEKMRYAELFMVLPKEWNPKPDEFKKHWAVQNLLKMARFPREEKSWLAWGQGVKLMNERVHPYSNMNGFMFLPTLLLPMEFLKLEGGEKRVNFLNTFPVYEEELDFQNENGMEAVFEQMDASETNEIVSINRKSFLSY